ncbi:hypothetical protein N7468_007871 [Penicillium chermesinum]|uniref:Xylanolytic transcriptional activator regulatory domain-containing protein n=1 Tax=Penicillium chermesinum TaxID=63820 RepID=A0A9W9NRN0_9EURO|nr:uncharacterized protein N7468_007871 [Penicillium chermesinum]KAJ5223329.1 hypothetical protein N7468_007871 [Penicillium chermesinum]
MSCCLYQIYSLGSGNRQLYQDADRSRGTLIGGLRGMGLLKSQISIDPESAPFKLNPHSDPLEVENEWLRWRDQEQERRVVWASFEYDCSLSTLTGCRAAVDLAELPRALPCAEDLWRAPSGQTWRSLASHLGPSAFGIPVTATLEPIMSGSKALPSGLSSWGKRLCCQVIGRLLWDLKQLEVISLTRVLRQPSLSLVQEQAKNGLLKGFDNISNEIKLPTSPVEVIDYK